MYIYCYVTACLHDHSFLFVNKFLMENLLKGNFVKVIPFTGSKFQTHVLLCTFVYMYILDLGFDSKDVLIGQFLSKSVKVSREIGYIVGFYSVKVHQSSLTKFLMQIYMIRELCQRKL